MPISLRRLAGAAGRRLARWEQGRTTDTPDTPDTAGPRPDPINVSALYAWLRAMGHEIRSPYLWGTLHAARAASTTGVERISALEFGVAGGNGLLALEDAASVAARIYGVAVDVYGFDGGEGLPEPEDYRDVPWAGGAGALRMDVEALRSRLRHAELVLGAVADTVPSWLDGEPAPVGFAAFDLDWHSSTRDAFAVFDADDARVQPRVVCYFDDVFGFGWNDYTGERAAIEAFNRSHGDRKIAKIPGLRYELPPQEFTRPWVEQMYLAHAFDHARYDAPEKVVPDDFLEANALRE